MNVPDRCYAGGKMVYAATLDDWKTQLAQQAAANHAAYLADQVAASTTAAASTTIASTSDAASIASSNAVASAAAKALATLTSPQPTGSDAQVALTLLQSAARATATSKAANAKSASATMIPTTKSSNAAPPDAAAHKMGETVSVTA